MNSHGLWDGMGDLNYLFHQEIEILKAAALGQVTAMGLNNALVVVWDRCGLGLSMTSTVPIRIGQDLWSCWSDL